MPARNKRPATRGDLLLVDPVRCYLPAGWEPTEADRKRFGYVDGKVAFEWRKYAAIARGDDRQLEAERQSGQPRRRHWFVEKRGRPALDLLVAELDAARRKSVLFHDPRSDGRAYWTHSGIAPELTAAYGWPATLGFPVPEPCGAPWDPKFPTPRPYQREAVDLLLRERHGAVELATGLGKSLIACMLLRRLGLPGLVLCPTLSICEQLYADLGLYLPPGAVGRYYGKWKESDRHVVVAVSAAMLHVVPGSTHDRALAAKQVLIGDESHMLPAECLSQVVLGRISSTPWRFFLSGTQIRPDGLERVLAGILGRLVMGMDLRAGVAGGWLAPFQMSQFLVGSPHPTVGDTGPRVQVNRAHLHANMRVYRHLARLVRWGLRRARRPLVLVEEIAQFKLLLPLLVGLRVGFAHGGLDAAQRVGIDPAYHASRPRDLVAAFDAGQLDVLVGTQCIGVGTDIRSASLICDVVGLASEIRLRQNVGRGSRLHPGKVDCLYVDYGVYDVPALAVDADRRRKILDETYGPVRVEVVA